MFVSQVAVPLCPDMIFRFNNHCPVIVNVTSLRPGLPVCWSVCQYFLKGREVTLRLLSEHLLGIRKEELFIYFDSGCEEDVYRFIL